MRIEIQPTKQETTILVLYSPEEDEINGVKEQFWDELTDRIKYVTGKLLIRGDLNSRVGTRTKNRIEILG